MVQGTFNFTAGLDSAILPLITITQTVDHQMWLSGLIFYILTGDRWNIMNTSYPSHKWTLCHRYFVLLQGTRIVLKLRFLKKGDHDEEHHQNNYLFT